MSTPGTEPHSADVLDTAAAGPATIRGGALRMIAYGASVLLALASAPLLIRHLGIEDFGRYVLVGTLLGLVSGVTDAGLATVAQREYVVRSGEDRERTLRNLLGLRIALTTGAVGLAVAYAALAGYGETLVLGTVIGGLGVIALALQGILATPLVAALRFGWITAVDLARQVATVAIMIALILAGSGVLAFLAIPLPIGLLTLGITVVLVRRMISLRPTFHRSEWWSLVRDTIPFAAATAVGAVYFRVALLLLDLLASDLETGYYATSYRIIEVVLAIPALLVSAVFPVLTRAARDDPERLRYVVGRVLEVALILGLWFLLCVELGARPVIDVLAGLDQAEPSVDVLRVQGPAVVATFIAVACAFPLLSLARYRDVLVANVLALVGSVSLTFVLVPMWGAEGAAAATVVAELVLAVAMLVLLKRARPELSLPLSVLGPLLLAAGLGASTLLVPVPDAVRVVLASVVFFGVLAALRRLPPELLDAIPRRRS